MSSARCASAPARPTPPPCDQVNKETDDDAIPPPLGTDRRCCQSCWPQARRWPTQHRRFRRSTPATPPGCWHRTALVLLMTIPGLALFYAGMVRKKNVLAHADAVLHHHLHRHHRLDGGRLQPGLHQRQRLCRRPVALHAERHRGQINKGVDTGFILGAGTDGAVTADDPRDRLHDVPDDLRDHHPGADRRRLRRPHEVLRACASSWRCGRC